MIIVCDYCLEKLREFGALLFSPPDMSGTCQKIHICKSCYEKMKP